MFWVPWRNMQQQAESLPLAVLLFLIVSCFFVYTPVSAQGGGGIDLAGTGGNNTINGRIYFPSGRRSDMSLKVRLEGVNTSGRTVFADSNGSFSFRNLEPGSYSVIVEGGDNYENARESVLIEDTRSKALGTSLQLPRNYTLPIYLQPKRSTTTSSKPEVINAALAGVPKAAADIYNAGLKLAESGQTEKAAEKFREALLVYPEFTLAMNELGVQYLKLGQPQRAVEVLKNAVALSPDAINPRINYGAALLGINHHHDAESQFRTVLKQSPTSAAAHFYLGVTLLGTPRDEGKAKRLDEAEKEFAKVIELGGAHVARAYYYLAGIYWDQSKFDRAADSLEAFLKSSGNISKEEREKTTATIVELRKKH
jgi:tetratricopeptide (TPR) repeat protein